MIETINEQFPNKDFKINRLVYLKTYTNESFTEALQEATTHARSKQSYLYILQYILHYVHSEDHDQNVYPNNLSWGFSVCNYIPEYIMQNREKALSHVKITEVLIRLRTHNPDRALVTLHTLK